MNVTFDSFCREAFDRTAFIAGQEKQTGRYLASRSRELCSGQPFPPLGKVFFYGDGKFPFLKESSKNMPFLFTPFFSAAGDALRPCSINVYFHWIK